MKRVIEITDIPTVTIVPTPGFYRCMGSIYFAQITNTIPVYIGMEASMVWTEVEVPAPQSTGIDGNTLLKAIAISKRPELAKELV